MRITFNIEFNTRWGEELYVETEKKNFRLQYTENGIWTGEIRLDTGSEHRILEYRYFVQNSGGETFYEAGKRRAIAINSSTTSIEAHDKWCSNSEEAPLLTAPFSEVLYRKDSAQYIYTHRYNNETIICVTAPKINSCQRLLICGNSPALGNWQIREAPEMTRVDGERWVYSTDGSDIADLQFKFLLATPSEDGDITYEWEKGENRTIPVSNRQRHKSFIWEQGCVIFDTAAAPHIAGCAIPLFSLRSKKSCGIGDFSDLRLLIDWAAKCGQRIIQLLPVNDTTSTNGWADSYPYNCISVFALHPIYLDIEALGKLPDERKYKEFRRDKKRLNNEYFLNYPEVMEVKSNYSRAIYKEYGKAVFAEPGFYTFIKENGEWLYPYAAFCTLRDYFKEPDFRKWETIEHNGIKLECSTFSDKIVETLKESGHSLNDNFNYHIYLQYHLHRQLSECKEYAHKMGVALKGDIPIGVSRNGADSWHNPQLFNFGMQAGAPPDAFSDLGQNWGFPTYDWEQMAKDNYSWWKKRLRHMQNYFDAYRIDHILGFFRIWEIPADTAESSAGHFSPALPLSLSEIAASGVRFSNSLFIEDPYCRKRYHPAILAKKSRRYCSMSAAEQEKFDRLYDNFFFERHNRFWYDNAVKKLQQLIAATNMLACGEDLGMLSEPVTRCMQNLHILSLEVLMMPKQFGADLGEPQKYPYLSVCTTSTHDSQTLRMWLGKRVCPQEPKDAPAEECLKIVRKILAAKSMIAVLPLQDWFSIEPKYRNRYFESERINDPSNPHNQWRFRTDVCLEDLLEDRAFCNKIKELISESGRE